MRLQLSRLKADFADFCAHLPSSLCALHLNYGRLLLPALSHLTALTELRLWDMTLFPFQGQLFHLPALRVLGLSHTTLHNTNDPLYPGPQDLGLAFLAPLLTEVLLELGTCGMSAPHEQLATLASLAQLNIVDLDFSRYDSESSEKQLRPDTLLSLPRSVTKLVLRDFDRCVPAIALPENVVIVHM